MFTDRFHGGTNFGFMGGAIHAIDRESGQEVFIITVNINKFIGNIKGILHQKNFYCLNLIFWIVMGCGIARFGRKGLKTTET